MEPYQEFALLYDELMNDIDYKSWYDYIKEIFKKYNKKPKTILEMACGTGNLTEYFCEDGYNITAFDISEDMLSITYNKLDKFKNLSILKQDMVNLNLGSKKFDIIICACDSMNYITREEDLKKVFENAYKCLNDGGLFIFDINSYYKLKNIIGNNTFVQDTGDIFYVWENEFLEDEEICNFYLTFFVNEGGLYRRFEEHHIERAYKTDVIKDYLIDAKFKEVYIYEDFKFSESSLDSERIFFVASN